jgi:hypothetical protein
MPAQGGKAQPTNTLPAPGQASTVPPQGSKGGAPSNLPDYAKPYMPTGLPPAQVPGQGKGAAPSNVPNYTQDQMKYLQSQIDATRPTGYPPAQVPPQGGKSQAQIDQINADMAAKRTGQPLVPAQGGKAPLPTGVGDAFPTPQVQKPGLDLANLGLSNMLYGGGGQQLAPGQVAPTQAEIDRLRPMLTTPMAQTPSNLPSYTQPAPVMPTPAPVAKPGIAGIAQKAAQMKAQQQAAKGRR